jgi:lactate permease
VVSALVAALPLALLLVMMGILRKSAYVSAASALAAALVLALTVWRMPVGPALASVVFGFVYGLWPIMWVVFAALWLYNLAVDAGSFELLRRWMREHASTNVCVQAILVAFCFGALLEGTAGFGAPVAIAAFLLVALGFSGRRAVTVALIANTTPVAFGALGIPVVALAGVTGLDLGKLSAMIGRQLPLLSAILPIYLVLVLAGWKGLRVAWPAALVGGGAFALTQFAISNTWGPYAADILASVVSIAALVLLLRVWRPAAPEGASAGGPEERRLKSAEAIRAWLPWAVLSIVMVGWSYLKLFDRGSIKLAVPHLHQAVVITLYRKPYAAIYAFQPLAAGTGALLAVILTAVLFTVPPGRLWACGLRTAKQLAAPSLTVGLIVALAYLYNYSGMTYTLGAALASLGAFFPFASGYLGWLACFMTGSDTASNLLFGNLQVAAAHQIGASPVLLAATNSSGAVMGKMISPQNICIGVTTVGLVGREGEVLRTTFWHSILLAGMLSTLALLQAHALVWMVP